MQHHAVVTLTFAEVGTCMDRWTPGSPPPAPPVLQAVVVDLLGGVDAVEVVQGPLLGCWDPLPLHLQDCLPPLPLTPPRH